MFTTKILNRTALAAVAATALVGVAVAQEAHKHEAPATETNLVLDHGKKWQTDEHARKAMQSIRTALASDLEPIHRGTQTAAQSKVLAEKVMTEVQYMVANCKLDPAADQQFHLVLGELIRGAESLEGKHREESPRQGAERIARTLNAYGDYFTHPGWKQL